MSRVQLDVCDHLTVNGCYLLMKKRKFYFILYVFPLLVLLWFMPGMDHAVHASVELLYFIGTPGNGTVELEWETATEIDNAGFYVSRTTYAGGNFVQIGEFIPAKGDSITGAYYSYIDNNVDNGDTYFYRLESWSTSNVVEYSEPISVTPGSPVNTATATVPQSPTATQSLTPQTSPSSTQTLASSETLTITPTNQDTDNTRTPTATSTRASIPAPTITPAPTTTPIMELTPTPILVSTPTPTEAAPVLPTTTLIPLPTIIVVVPQTKTVEPTVTQTSSPTPTQEPNTLDTIVKTGFKVLGIVGLLCVVGILWLLIVIWFILLINRFST